MLKAYKYQLDLNESQKTFFNKSFGCSRYIYNWALDKKIKAYQDNKTKLSAYDLSASLTVLKKEIEWLKEVNSQTLQQSIRNMESAFTRFFREKKGFPKFHSKHGKQSCKFTTVKYVDFEKRTITIPSLGKVRFFCDRQFVGKLGTVTVFKNAAGKYFASFCVDTGDPIPAKAAITEYSTIGIDVGISSFATLSDGTKIDNPKYLEKAEKRLKVLQRRLSRKQKGSNRRKAAKLRVAKHHYKVTCKRNDFLHKLSSKIISENQTIIIEDLNVQGMIRNHKLAKSILSVSWSEFFRQLKYKANWHGKNLILIGRFEPSSKMCSCGIINNELKLSDRDWTCSSCGLTHDRDFLAAQNIKRFGLVKQNLVGISGDAFPVEDVEILPLGRSMKRQVKKATA